MSGDDTLSHQFEYLDERLDPMLIGGSIKGRGQVDILSSES